MFESCATRHSRISCATSSPVGFAHGRVSIGKARNGVRAVGNLVSRRITDWE